MLASRKITQVCLRNQCTLSTIPPVASSAKSQSNLKRHNFDLPLSNAGLVKTDFQTRRQALAEKLAEANPVLGKASIDKPQRQHLVVIPSAQRRYMVDKIPYLFRQSTVFRYLTGSLSHNSALVLKFDGSLNLVTSTLVLPEIDPREAKWEGPQMRADEACDIFGIDQAIHMDELPSFLHSQIVQSAKNLVLWYDYLNPTHANVHRILMRFVEGSNVVNQPVQSPKQAVHQLQLIKSPREIQAMRQTCKIGAETIMETIRSSRAFQSETQIFAKLDYESRMRGADFLSFPPVVAEGDHDNTIHYTSYSKLPMDEDNLMLVDCGSDYGGYCSDITRTWPISGKFNPCQKLVYQAVLDIQDKIIQELNHGNAAKQTIDNLYRKMQSVMGQHLADIGLVSQDVARDPLKLAAACNEFCPHHVSHYLGMDVHDTALVSRNIPLQEGMVITVEPGIYIPRHPAATSKYLSRVPEEFRGMGVRIEDDVLITRHPHCEVLSQACPKNLEDIEELVGAQ